jgi:hypothetical protein
MAEPKRIDEELPTPEVASDGISSKQPEGPMLAISDNGRYFNDAGQPNFWLGDTQWNLFRCHAPDSAREFPPVEWGPRELRR